MNPATEDLTRRYGRIITGLLDAITAHNRVLPAWLFPVLNKLFFATHIRVINLSLGRPVFEAYNLDPLCLAVEAAWKAGS